MARRGLEHDGQCGQRGLRSEPDTCAGAAARAKRPKLTPPSPTATGYMASSTDPWRQDWISTNQPAAPIRPEPVRAATGRMSAKTPMGAILRTQPTMTSMVCAMVRSSSESGVRCGAESREGESKDERKQHQRHHGVARRSRDRVRRQQVGQLIGHTGTLGAGPPFTSREQGVAAHRPPRPQGIDRRRDHRGRGRNGREERDEQSERNRRRPAGGGRAARVRHADDHQRHDERHDRHAQRVEPQGAEGRNDRGEAPGEIIAGERRQKADQHPERQADQHACSRRQTPHPGCGCVTARRSVQAAGRIARYCSVKRNRE